MAQMFKIHQPWPNSHWYPDLWALAITLSNYYLICLIDSCNSDPYLVIQSQILDCQEHRTKFGLNLGHICASNFNYLWRETSSALEEITTQLLASCTPEDPQNLLKI